MSSKTAADCGGNGDNGNSGGTKVYALPLAVVTAAAAAKQLC